MNQRADPIRDAGIVIRSSVIGRPTQRTRILDRLRSAGRDGVCSWDLAFRAAMPNASSRIPELNDDGYVIEGETKNWPDENHGAHAHYFLVSEPAPEQRALFVMRKA